MDASADGDPHLKPLKYQWNFDIISVETHSPQGMGKTAIFPDEPYRRTPRRGAS